VKKENPVKRAPEVAPVVPPQRKGPKREAPPQRPPERVAPPARPPANAPVKPEGSGRGHDKRNPATAVTPG
jgi:hypothetical protein